MVVEESEGNSETTTNDGFAITPDWDGEANPHAGCYSGRARCPLGIDHNKGALDVCV